MVSMVPDGFQWFQWFPMVSMVPDGSNGSMVSMVPMVSDGFNGSMVPMVPMVSDGFRCHGMIPHKHYQSWSRSYCPSFWHAGYGGANGKGNLLSATATIRP